MSEPEPHYKNHTAKEVVLTATYPDVELVPEKPKLPQLFRRYLEQRHRGLLTEIHEVRKLLGMPRLKEPRIR